MKPSFGFVRLVTFTCLLSLYTLNPWQSLAQDAGKKKNDQVKLESNQVELIEVSETASQCPNQKGTTLRIKVIASSTVDVRVYAQNMRGRWYAADYKAKKQGDEVTMYTCLLKGKFKVQTRAASDTPWQ